MAEADYEAKKAQLPAVSLAIRYPIENLESKLELLPDLDKVMPEEKKEDKSGSFMYVTKFSYVEH